MITRCAWPTKPLDIAYHDTEWGVPVYDRNLLFEMLTLEGAQAGLSWSTVLAKREGYRAAFHSFKVEQVAEMTTEDVDRLVLDPSIIRHRGKIESTIRNAQIVLALPDFPEFLWAFVNGKPINGHRATHTEIPAKTPESDAMSKALQKLGFKFVGSTICYAFMQACGMVNDHTIDCFRHREISTHVSAIR